MARLFSLDVALTLICVRGLNRHLAMKAPSVLPRTVTLASHPTLYPALKVAGDIVSKLLQKQAEDRFQTCDGLLHDCTAVLAQMPLDSVASEQSSSLGLVSAIQSHAPSNLLSFQVGLLDRSSTFRLSQKLYGREAGQ